MRKLYKHKRTLGSPCVDHCHSTKVVRGVIHHRCNMMIGLAKDNTELLKKAIKYLNKFKKRICV